MEETAQESRAFRRPACGPCNLGDHGACCWQLVPCACYSAHAYQTAVMADVATVTVTVTVPVPEEWIELVTHGTDLFRTDHAGYWLCGVEHDQERGWLVWEEDEQLHEDLPLGRKPNEEEARGAWMDGRPLPAGWYRLDRDAAVEAFRQGLMARGADWYENADSDDYDNALQLALFGELRYA